MEDNIKYLFYSGTEIVNNDCLPAWICLIIIWINLTAFGGQVCGRRNKKPLELYTHVHLTETLAQGWLNDEQAGLH